MEDGVCVDEADEFAAEGIDPVGACVGLVGDVSCFNFDGMNALWYVADDLVDFAGRAIPLDGVVVFIGDVGACDILDGPAGAVGSGHPFRVPEFEVAVVIVDE